MRPSPRRISLAEQQSRLANLRDDLEHVEEITTKDTPAERHDESETLAAFLEKEIRERLPVARHPESTALIRASVALIAVTDKRGPAYGSDLDALLSDTTEPEMA